MAKRGNNRKRDREQKAAGPKKTKRGSRKSARESDAEAMKLKAEGRPRESQRDLDDPSLDYDSIEEIETARGLCAQEQHDLIMLFRARTGGGLRNADGGLLRQMLSEAEDRAKEEQLEQRARALAATVPFVDGAEALAEAREFIKLTEEWTPAHWKMAEACGF